jgi:hypothetical protein
MPLRPPAGFISAFYDPLNNPNAPTIGTATAGDATASVAFTAPADVGGSAISLYGARSTPDSVTATAASSPISVTGLTNGTAYTFAVWAINTYGPSAFSAASNSVTPAAPDRGLFGGGSSNVIDYVAISTLGNATDFGDLTNSPAQTSALANSVRGIWSGGASTNVIQYITIATTGNAADFGDLLAPTFALAGLANSTRGVIGGGFNNTTSSATNVIQYVTIATTGDAIDFGDLNKQRRGVASASSSTRGLFAGGVDTDFNGSNTIDYVTIASTGNATNFGQLIITIYLFAGCSSSTRAVFGGGSLTTTGATQNVIQYVTIASTGNATDFGDLLNTNTEAIAACSNATRGLFAGGADGPATNLIQYITIASTGNSIDFGDLTTARSTLAGCSDCGGGLQ